MEEHTANTIDEKYRKLNAMQLKAVMHDKGPLLILAGAGSGKTGVITNRIAYLIEKRNVDPYRIIALTFTNKAANEMKERVEGLVGEEAQNIWVSTFHSSCVRILRRFIDTIGFGRDFTIYDTDDQKSLMRDVFKYLSIDPKQIKEKAVLAAISHAKDELIDPEMYEKDAGRDPVSRRIAMCYKEYQSRLKKNNALDFDDLIVKTIELFETNEEALAYYRRRFEYILIDEYQDTNTAQFKLIRLLADHENEYGEIEHNLCVVGDDDQSIYRFRGANIRNILDFEKCYKDTEVIRLEQNYRSTKSVLEAANEVIRHNIGRKAKTLWTENEQGDPVTLISFGSDRDESDRVIGSIAESVREGNAEYRDFAILYRTNAQSRSFEEKAVYKNVPYKLIGGQNFYQRKEIKDMLAYLRTIAGGSDGVAVKRIINIPKRGIGLTTLDKVDEYAAANEISFYDTLTRAEYIPELKRASVKISSFVSLVEVLKGKLRNGLSLTDLLDELLEATEYVDYLMEEEEEEKVKERVANINELVSKLAQYEETALDKGEKPDLRGFLDEVSLVADIDDLESGDDRVVMMTVHSAKGLEFPYVFMVGMDEGLFPSAMSIYSDNPDEEIEEERRLCYVGMTRAQKKLVLTCASQRMQRGEIAFFKPSRFINEIPRHMLERQGEKVPRRLSEEPEYEYNCRKKDDFENYRDCDNKYPHNEKRSYDRGNYDRGSYSYDDLMYEAPAGKRNTVLSENPYAKPKSTTGFRDLSSLGSLVSKGVGGTSGDLGYGVGDSVSHIKFGIGTVTAIEQGGRDYQVTVNFPSGTKKMLASFAKLKRIDK